MLCGGAGASRATCVAILIDVTAHRTPLQGKALQPALGLLAINCVSPTLGPGLIEAVSGPCGMTGGSPPSRASSSSSLKRLRTRIALLVNHARRHQGGLGIGMEERKRQRYTAAVAHVVGYSP